MNSLWAVVPAAGSGRRLGGDTPKQYREIAGAPLLEHTLRALLGSADVRGVVVALDLLPRLGECPHGGSTQALQRSSRWA